MLIYLGTGERRYGENPLGVQRRRAWEFQAVLKGRIGVVLPEGAQPLLAERLWIFPPGHLHGWVGEKSRPAQVAVFHFLAVPEPLKQLIGPRGFIETELNRRDLREIHSLAQSVTRYWRNPMPGMTICYERALMSLSLLTFENSGARLHSGPASHHQDRVNAAIQWYAERMETNPSFQDIAAAAAVSPAHLRRLFHEVLQASPNQIMDQLRFQRAMQLMADPGVKLEEVSYRCGFSCASAFSRAFKIKFGCSPQSWRA
jgi:AraC family transcriptional regulator